MLSAIKLYIPYFFQLLAVAVSCYFIPLLEEDLQIAGKNMSADPVTPLNITEMKPDGKSC